MSSKPPSEGQQNQSVWGWTNSINSFVENAKTSSDSFFDNVTATFAKTQSQNMHKTDTKNDISNTTNAYMTAQMEQKQIETETDNSDPYSALECELKQMKSKYSQLQTDYSLKSAMLRNEFQTYKDTNLSFTRQMSSQKDSQISELQSQIQSFQKNEKQCMDLFAQNITKYTQNSHDLQRTIDTKYQMFYEKLLNITVKAGLSPDQIFHKNESINSNEDTVIHNAEECTNVTNTKIGTNILRKYEERIAELQTKLKQSKCANMKYETKMTEMESALTEQTRKCESLEQSNTATNGVCKELNAKLTQISTQILHKSEAFQELETLWAGMSDTNTEFQQQIKDVNAENALLRAELNSVKAQKQSETAELVLRNGEFKESLRHLQLKCAEMCHKLGDESEVSAQLRAQIKQTSKLSNKRSKANSKLRKKLETFERDFQRLQSTHEAQRQKVQRYVERVRECEANEGKYNNAIGSYKALQRTVEEYISENNELKLGISQLRNEVSNSAQHSHTLRTQAVRDTKNLSRLTNCNAELAQIIGDCEAILVESAHKYLPISVISDGELELSDDSSENQRVHTVINCDDNDGSLRKTNNIFYFDDSSDSDDALNQKIRFGNGNGHGSDDEIFKAAKANDIRSLQRGARLKIQCSVMAEQLQKFMDRITRFKHELHRKSEESLQQSYELRQVAMRRRLQSYVKRELGKRERNMVSIASVRGVNTRHKTSLANLTKAQDRVDRIVSDIAANDELWKSNISMQLRGNTKASSMDLLLMDTTTASATTSSMSLKSGNGRQRKRFLSDNDVPSVRSLSSGYSKKSIRSQSALSLNDRNTQKRLRLRQKQRQRVLQPMQTMQSNANESESVNNNNIINGSRQKKKSFGFGIKWFQ